MVSYDRPHSFNGGPMYSSTVGAVKRGGKRSKRGGNQTKRVVIKTKRGKYTMPLNSKLHKACVNATDQEKCIEDYRNTRKNPIYKTRGRPPAYTLLGYTDYNMSASVPVDVIINTKIPDPIVLDTDKIELSH